MCCVLQRSKDFKNDQAKTGCFRFARQVSYRLAKGRRYTVVGYETRPARWERRDSGPARSNSRVEVNGSGAR